MIFAPKRQIGMIDHFSDRSDFEGSGHGQMKKHSIEFLHYTLHRLRMYRLCPQCALVLAKHGLNAPAMAVYFIRIPH
jgi:hypothetical protein